MVFLLSTLIGIAIAVCAWFFIKRAEKAWSEYQTHLTAQARQTLDDAFLFYDLSQLKIFLYVVLAISLLFIAWILGRWWGLLPLLLVFLSLPKPLFKFLKLRRLRQFDQQLPDLLLSLAGAVKAGASMQQALKQISEQSLPPIAQEFGLLIRQQRLGQDFKSALADLHQRVPTESCALLVSALNISLQTGGALAETLENLADTIRTRNYWSGRVKALTAQGRMQSNIMAALPILLFFVLRQLEPEAMSLLWQSWYGFMVLFAVMVLEVLGIIWVRRIVNIDI